MVQSNETQHFNGTASGSRKRALWMASAVVVVLFVFSTLFVSQNVQDTIEAGDNVVDTSDKESSAEEVLDSPIPSVDVETLGDTDANQDR